MGRPALVGGALEVVLEVHPHGAGQQVVHHHDPDVLPPGLHAVQPVKFGKEGPGVLVQVLENVGMGLKFLRFQGFCMGGFFLVFFWVLYGFLRGFYGVLRWEWVKIGDATWE